MRSRALNDLRLARIRLKKPVRPNLPAVLLDAMAACRLIVEERDRFPELGSGKGQKRFQFGSPNRERHLRGLETIALCLMSILSHVDLVTLRSGKPRRDGSCDAIRVTKPRRPGSGRRASGSIQEETGRGSNAVSAALRDLVDAGYLTRHQPKRDYLDDVGNKHWRSFPTVYTVTKTCFARLGVDLGELEDQRQKASKRQTELPAPIIDIRLRRARQQMIRAQAMAAKRVTAGKSTTWSQTDEAYRQGVLRRMADRLKKRE